MKRDEQEESYLAAIDDMGHDHYDALDFVMREPVEAIMQKHRLKDTGTLRAEMMGAMKGAYIAGWRHKMDGIRL